jgi:RNA polymerase sigma-70 factor (ECF subfamily)
MSDSPKPKRPSSDESLLARFQRGHNDAATALYLRYAKRIHSLVKSQRGADLSARLDPEDVVQSVFRTFFRRAATGHYSVPAGDELWKLFLVIALHKTRDASSRHRAAKRDVRQTRPIAPGESTIADKQNDEALSVLQLTIDELLGRLPKTQRQIVELRIAGFEVTEIAEKTGRARRSIERILQEFRDRLRTQTAAE